MLDVDTPSLATVQALVAARLPHATVTAFGSRVRGWPFGRTSKPYSDLDLAVWPDPGDPGLELALAELRADFEDSALPWRVDLSQGTDLPPKLQQLIRDFGEVLQSPTPARAPPPPSTP